METGSSLYLTSEKCSLPDFCRSKQAMLDSKA
jgi:hypothetical protein